MNREVLPIAQCDVHDRKALQAYRSKRDEWIGWLSGDSENDVWTQLSRMTWNDAVFRLINEGLRLADHSQQLCAIHNRMLIDFALEGYLANQVLAVRRLLDKRDDVNSLYRLVQDIEKSRPLITRENYVAFDGVPYDSEPGQQRAMERALRRKDAGEGAFEWLPTTGSEDWVTSGVRHTMFDRLSREGSRSRSDLIDPSVLDRLRQMVDRARYREFITIANKFLAHAADKKSRRGLMRRDIAATLNLIQDAHKNLLSACHVLSVAVIDYADRSWLAVAQYNKLENLDKSWVPSHTIEQLHEWWDGHERKLRGWRQGAVDLVLESEIEVGP